MGRKTKYKPRYATDLVDYFKRFIELREDPELDDKAERNGMVTMNVTSSGDVEVTRKPCSGYPALVKFAIKIGVTPQTLNNWAKEHDDFKEAMEFADIIQDEVLNERALSGEVDGRVAMKIRELKMNSRKMEVDASGSGARLVITLNDDREAKKAEITEWTGDVNEDTEY